MIPFVLNETQTIVKAAYNEDIDEPISIAVQHGHELLAGSPYADPEAILVNIDTALGNQVREHIEMGGKLTIDKAWLQAQLNAIKEHEGFPDLDAIALLPIYLRYRFALARSGTNKNSEPKADGGTLVLTAASAYQGERLHPTISSPIPEEANGLVKATKKLVTLIEEKIDTDEISQEELTPLGDRAQQVYESWVKYAIKTPGLKINPELLGKVLAGLDNCPGYEAGNDYESSQFTPKPYEGYWLLAIANMACAIEGINAAIAGGDTYPDPDSDTW